MDQGNLPAALTAFEQAPALAEDLVEREPAYAMCDIYIKGTYLIIKYTDAGTPRYKSLDLSGTTPPWQHSTTEP